MKTRQEKISLIIHQDRRLTKIINFYLENTEIEIIKESNLVKGIFDRYSFNTIAFLEVIKAMEKFKRVEDMIAALHLKFLYIKNPKGMDYHRNWYYGGNHYLPKDFKDSLIKTMQKKKNNYVQPTEKVAEWDENWQD